MSKPAAVYRFWDASDMLLYIGVTENPDGRFGGHESTKPWWPDVARKELELVRHPRASRSGRD